MPNLLAKGQLARWSGIAGVTLATLTVTAGSVLAATAEPGAEHSGGLPQLNPATFPTQIFWLAIAFVVLYVLLSKRVLPRIAEVIEERQERISRDLNKAASLKEEAEAVMAQVEKALADARSEAQSLIASAAAEIEANNQTRQSELNTQLAERLRVAEANIAKAKDEALANVRAMSGEIAREVAARVAGVQVDTADADAAVASVIGERHG